MKWTFSTFFLVLLLPLLTLLGCGNQRKLLSHSANRFRAKPMRCERIGEKKVRQARIPRCLRKKMAQRTETSPENKTTASKLAAKSTAPAEATALASADEKAVIAETASTEAAADTKAATDSLESEDESSTGSLWYTHSKAVGPKIKPLGFDKDSDPPSPEELAAMKKAMDYLKYGYTIKLTEYLPQGDIDSGRNVPYKRANRLKTKLISMGAPPSAIFFESRVIAEGESGTRRVAIELVVE
jgi:uncharacterized lipoprotein NlpE involved in copper resistance